jgi:glycine/D-amino acid oxidase-like deaminating enzyme
MVTTLGRAVSQPTLWSSTVDAADRAALDPGVHDDLDRRPDVLVIGGGVIGLATALFCGRAGLGRVLVIEARHLAAGASGGAAGLPVPELHRLGDPPAFVAFARSSLALYRRLDAELEGALGLKRRPTLLVLPEGPPPPRPWAEVELLDSDRVAELEPDLAPVPAALLAADQARAHPLRLAARCPAGLPAWRPGWR